MMTQARVVNRRLLAPHFAAEDLEAQVEALEFELAKVECRGPRRAVAKVRARLSRALAALEGGAA